MKRKPPPPSADPLRDAHDLVTFAQSYVRTYARIMARDVPPEMIEPIIAAVGEISIDAAVRMLADLQHAQHPEDDAKEPQP